MDGDIEKQKEADGETCALSGSDDLVVLGSDVQTQAKTLKNENSKQVESVKVGNENNRDRSYSEVSQTCESKIEASPREEKHDEDVPEDFFDDFLKEDFMAGLDIVDEDDEEPDDKRKGESGSKLVGKVSNEQKLKNSRKYNKEKIDHVKKFRESPPGESIKLIKKRKKKKIQDELKELDAELAVMRETKPKKPDKLKSDVDADNFDIRRDPEKTRRAIQRDKIKSAKDKEKRLITDIVETGLVPPGMELEVDMEEVCRIEKHLPIGDLRQKIRPRKSRSPEQPRSFVKKRTPPRKRSHTPSKRRKSRTPTNKNSVSVLPDVPGAGAVLDSDQRKSTSHQSTERSISRRSPLRKSPRLLRSPLSRRSPLRHNPLIRRSPHLRRSPLMTRRSPTFRRRSRSRSPILRRNSRSISTALRRKSRSRSPILHRRSRSRDRSPAFRRRNDRNYSPLGRDRRRRSRSPKRMLRKEEKISFLEELAAKLNETHPSQATLPTPATVSYVSPSPAAVSYVLPAPSQPVMAPVPAPVPPPQSVFFSAPSVPQPQLVSPTIQQFDHYDQSFFIGSSPSLHQREQPQLIQQHSRIQGASQPNGFPRNDSDLGSKGDIAKLFGDKRIKLSDFLAITAKPQVNNSSPAKLQEKIKVIQRCQEAIKILNDKRFAGPLVVHKTDSYQSSKDMTMSPLLRKPIIQLPFTTPGLKKSSEMDFIKCCETLLCRIGIEKSLPLHKEPEKPKVVPPKEIPQKEMTPPVFSSTRNYSEIPTPIKIITKASSSQTDKELSSCKECLRRKGILYAHCGVQAGNPTISFSVSTQVNEADFYSMIPKTQSLASLTPAQLLGKQSMITDHSRSGRNVATQENMQRINFQVPSPPPPPIFHYISPNQTTQRDGSIYPPPLFNQPAIPSFMQGRPNFDDNQKKSNFSDNRRGGYNNKRF